MSRTTNQDLTKKILSAAKRLWNQSGEEGLTVRAVAEAAGTTTPSVYQRFPSKQGLVAALGDRARLQLASQLMKSATIEEACRTYLEVAQRHPNQYRLIFGPGLPRVLGMATRRPFLEWLQRRFAQRFAGTPAEHETRAYAIFLLLHGAASMLQFAPRGEVSSEIRERCLKACQAVIGGAARNGHSPRKTR